MVNEGDYVAIFHSIHRVLRAEQLLKRAGVVFLLIPVPRQLTADCGLALRIAPPQLMPAYAVLAAAVLLPAELHRLSAGDFVAAEPPIVEDAPGTA